MNDRDMLLQLAKVGANQIQILAWYNVVVPFQKGMENDSESLPNLKAGKQWQKNFENYPTLLPNAMSYEITIRRTTAPDFLQAQHKLLHEALKVYVEFVMHVMVGKKNEADALFEKCRIMIQQYEESSDAVIRAVSAD